MSKGYVARVTITVNATRERVWDALTNPALIKEYLFGADVTSTWKVGGPITYRGEWQGKTYEDKGTILEFVPEKRFASTYWSSLSGEPDLPENYSTVTWELSGANGTTEIALTQDNNSTEESLSRSENNWRTVLATIKSIVER